jgi:hypothetical protein
VDFGNRIFVFQVEFVDFGNRIFVFQVEFVDFGNVEYVSYDKLRADVFEFIKIPMLCLPCILHSVIPVSISRIKCFGGLYNKVF